MRIVFDDVTTGYALAVDEGTAFMTLLEMHGGDSASAEEDLRAVKAGEPITVSDVDIYVEED